MRILALIMKFVSFTLLRHSSHRTDRIRPRFNKHGGDNGRQNH